MIWLNAAADPASLSLPENAWVQDGEVVLSTDPEHPHGEHVRAGEVVDLAARSVLVMRQR